MDTSIGTPLDYWIIIAYFIGILGFGSFFGKFIKGTKDFFFAGQKLSWWLVGMSCVATTVGSYSFVKYSEVAFKYGFSSSQTYLNDWFWMPFWMFGWLPIIYFSRVTSIPEYFERRFGALTRMMCTIIMLLYLIGYIGINFYTLGLVLHKLLGWDIFVAATVVAVISAIYVTYGGQTSVIMTDLVQGFLLLFAGFALFFFGISYLGGFETFWTHLPVSFKSALSPFNKPADFNFVGIFWQDGVANTAAFYFMNQGVMLRFLSTKSVREGRKAIVFVVLVLMPLAAFAVANVGWIGRSMVTMGLLPADINSKDVFVVVSDMLCKPGVFGIILAALTAALMSTADTLINAVSVIIVNDIYKPYVRKGASDKHYLYVARVVSIVAAIVGIALVPVYMSFKTIYMAHGAFTAAITPPVVVAILLGAFWKRYTPAGAFWTLLGGILFIFASIAFPVLVKPFAHGVPPEGGYSFMRAFYGLVVSTAIGVIVSLFTKPRTTESIRGLTVSTLCDAARKFKGGEPNEEPGKRIKLKVKLLETPEPELKLVRFHPDDLALMNANPGDLAHIADPSWWHGGLRSANVRVGVPHEEKGVVYVAKDLVKTESLRPERGVVAEKIM